jgi:hypothetical protein
MQLRTATSADAVAVADLHADSWRRHYRGLYRDEYLDGEVFAERRAVWTARFADTRADTRTFLAEHDGVLVGFAHVIFDDDPTWGALLDNLHVVFDPGRGGMGGSSWSRRRRPCSTAAADGCLAGARGEHQRAFTGRSAAEAGGREPTRGRRYRGWGGTPGPTGGARQPGLLDA